MMLESEFFQLDGTDFGVGQTALVYHEPEGLLTLEISGSEEVAAALAANETHPFSWILYPLKLYIRATAFREEKGSRTIKIDEEALDKYDIALYLLEHHDVFGTLTIMPGRKLTFHGSVMLDGREVDLAISAGLESGNILAPE